MMIKYGKLLMFLLLMATVSCKRTDNVEGLLQDEEDRKKVYTSILNDEEMRNEMMALMRERNMGGMMGAGGMMRGGGMMGDSTGMEGMNRQQMRMHMQQMITICQSDTAACNLMSQMMLQHPGMMGNMMQRMQQQGMIDSTCLQQMKRQLNR